ncbi:MAG: glycosyltransferase family 39 protein [Nitrospinota bacterium]|nr:glycosyltransferase family 39 protein [Nitrospinota bacterium]
MKLKSDDKIVLSAILIIVSVFIQFIFRRFDDNTLARWGWVFYGAEMGEVYLFLVLALAVAFMVSKLESPGRYPRTFLFALSFFAAVPAMGMPEIILDAGRYFLEAKHLEMYGAGYFLSEWGGGIPVWTDMPLVPMIYGLLFSLFGEERIYVQLFNMVLFSSTVVITFLIGKELWDEERGFYAGLFLLAIPYLLTQVPLMMVDIPTMFMTTASYYVFIIAVREGSTQYLLLSPFMIFLAVLTKYSAILLLAPLPALAFVISDHEAKVVLKRVALVSAALLLLASLAVLGMGETILKQARLFMEYQAPRLDSWGESHVSTFLFQVSPFLAIFSLIGAYTSYRERDKKFLVVLWIAVIAFLLELKRIRYLLPLFPMLALAASCGVCSLGEREVRRFAGFGIVSVSLAIFYLLYLPFLGSISTANIKDAGEFIDTLKCGSVGVYILPQKNSKANTEIAIPLLDIFSDKEMVNIPNMEMRADDEAQASSLRFTWAPDWGKFARRISPDEKLPIAVVSSEKLIEAPIEIINNLEEHGTLALFEKSTNAFKFKTYVTIFGKECS